MHSLLYDLRHSLRLLTAKPGFAATVVLALGLGIGANAALFTVVNGLLFRPFPYTQPSELYEVSQPRRSAPIDELRTANSFSSVAAFAARGFPVTMETTISTLYGLRVSANIFDTLGVQPMFGRTFTADEDQPETPRTVVLSYEYWRTISGDPAVIGTDLTIDGVRHFVIGVMPAGFQLSTRDANVFVPARLTDGRILARTKPGIGAAQAESEVRSIIAGLPPEPGAAARTTPPRVIPLEEAFRPNDISALLLLQGAVGLVLLITCANVGNLMLVRATARRREFAIRSAIGAKPLRLLRQLVTESAVLAALGGALGLTLASWSLDAVSAQLPANLSRILRGPEMLSIDTRVLAFTAGAAMLVVVLAGLAPAVSSLRLDVVSHLKESAKSAAPERRRLGQALVVAEIGLAVMLLIGAGLMMKSILHLANQDLGFRADHVMRAAVTLPLQGYTTPEQRLAAFRDISQRIAALPGVEEASLLAPQLFPFGGPNVRGAVFEIQGQADGEPRAEVYTASAGYFRALRIPVLRGRGFTEADVLGGEPVALVSALVARRHFGPEDPVGRRIRVDLANPDSPWLTVIGVVGDVRNPVALDEQPTIYRPWAQNPQAGAAFMIRTSGEPLALAEAVRNEVKAVVPAAAEARTADLGLGVAGYISPQRFTASVLGGFAGVGLLLAAVGVYGVMRYWVYARVPEMGIRMALGARPGDLMRLVLRRAAWTAAAGVALGTAGAVALGRVIEAQLYGVSATDTAVFVAVPVVMGLVAVVAAVLPARAAAKVDPLVALREG